MKTTRTGNIPQPKGQRNGRKRCLQFREVLQNLLPVRLALFRVKLRREQILAPDGGAKRMSVLRLNGNDASIFRNDVIRMHEIEKCAVGDALQHWRAAFN